MRVGVVEIAAQQVLVEIPVRGEMPARVHRDEARVLQEARIDLATLARIVRRHRVDHVVLEPFDRLRGGEVVDLGRAAACVDRATHHRHRARRRFTGRSHQRDRREHGHGRLADRDDVQVLRADMADEFLDIGDVVVEMERACFGRHHARVDPVGDVDLVILQQRAHGVAQQRGVVAGQRRDDEHGRIVLQLLQCFDLVAVALEADQVAERLGQRHLLDDRHGVAMRLHLVDVERRLFVVLAEAVEQLVVRRRASSAGQLRQPALLRGEHARAALGERDQRVEQGAVEFVQLVQKHRHVACDPDVRKVRTLC
jgi:hypothetical protein